MKNQTKLILGLLLALLTLPINADVRAGLETTKTPVEIKKGKPLSGEPRTPTLQRIECYYENGSLYFSFDIPEGNATLITTEVISGTSSSQTFSTNSPTYVYIGEYTTTVWIEIQTADGNEYEGWLYE